jgi:hypothetical protein
MQHVGSFNLDSRFALLDCLCRTIVKQKKNMCADWVSRSVEFSWLRCFDKGKANSNKQSFLYASRPAMVPGAKHQNPFQNAYSQQPSAPPSRHAAGNQRCPRAYQDRRQDTLHHIRFRQTMQVVRYSSRGFREHSVKFPQNQGGNHSDRYVPPQRPLRAKDAMVQQ